MASTVRLPISPVVSPDDPLCRVPLEGLVGPFVFPLKYFRTALIFADGCLLEFKEFPSNPKGGGGPGVSPGRIADGGSRAPERPAPAFWGHTRPRDRVLESPAPAFWGPRPCPESVCGRWRTRG